MLKRKDKAWLAWARFWDDASDKGDSGLRNPSFHLTKGQTENIHHSLHCYLRATRTSQQPYPLFRVFWLLHLLGMKKFSEVNKIKKSASPEINRPSKIRKLSEDESKPTYYATDYQEETLSPMDVMTTLQDNGLLRREGTLIQEGGISANLWLPHIYHLLRKTSSTGLGRVYEVNSLISLLIQFRTS